MGSVSFFSALVEPWLLSLPFSRRDLCLGAVVLGGVLLIYLSLPHDPPSSHAHEEGGTKVHYGGAVLTGEQYHVVVVSRCMLTCLSLLYMPAHTGLLASMLSAVFVVLNKKYIRLAPSTAIATLEMAAGTLLLTLTLPILNPLLFGEETTLLPSLDAKHLTLDRARDGPWDLIWVLVLALLCTNVTFFLSMYALRQLSAFTFNLTGNLEPIYGIVFGAVFFKVSEGGR